MPSIDHLQAYPLFSGLTEDELTAVAACLSKRALAKGAYLYHPGNPGQFTYLVESGLMRMFFTDELGKEFLVNLAGPGDVFGLPLWQGPQTRVVGAAALSPAVVLVIQREDLFRLMGQSQTFTFNIYRELSDNVRNLTLRVRALTTCSLNRRLANMLLYLSDRTPSGEAKDEVFVPLSQGEIAGWLGASRGRLNRAVKEMTQFGLIRLDGQKYILLDREGLERLRESPDS